MDVVFFKEGFVPLTHPFSRWQKIQTDVNATNPKERERERERERMILIQIICEYVKFNIFRDAIDIVW